MTSYLDVVLEDIVRSHSSLQLLSSLRTLTGAI